MSKTEPGEQSGSQRLEDSEGDGEEATPRISGDDQEPGQTSHPAPDDDVGVPPDEELGDEDAGEGENRSDE
jgi:hypothetical protein